MHHRTATSTFNCQPDTLGWEKAHLTVKSALSYRPK
jgi:hypothetical protein